MTTMTALVSLVFGKPAAFKRKEHITVCRVDGCMAEQLTPLYKGVVTRRTNIACYGAPKGTIPGIVITVTETFSSDISVGQTRSEPIEHLRRLADNSLVVAN